MWISPVKYLPKGLWERSSTVALPLGTQVWRKRQEKCLKCDLFENVRCFSKECSSDFTLFSGWQTITVGLSRTTLDQCQHTHTVLHYTDTFFFLCEILIILFVNNQGTDTNSTSIKSNRLWFLSTLSLALNLAATLWVLLRAHPHAQIRSRYFEHCSQLWQKKKKIPEFTPPFSTFISGIKPECIAVRPSHSPRAPWCNECTRPTLAEFGNTGNWETNKALDNLQFLACYFAVCVFQPHLLFWREVVRDADTQSEVITLTEPPALVRESWVTMGQSVSYRCFVAALST